MREGENKNNIIVYVRSQSELAGSVVSKAELGRWFFSKLIFSTR
jgi:hypothetical protein